MQRDGQASTMLVSPAVTMKPGPAPDHPPAAHTMHGTGPWSAQQWSRGGSRPSQPCRVWWPHAGPWCLCTPSMALRDLVSPFLLQVSQGLAGSQLPLHLPLAWAQASRSVLALSSFSSTLLTATLPQQSWLPVASVPTSGTQSPGSTLVPGG